MTNESSNMQNAKKSQTLFVGFVFTYGYHVYPPYAPVPTENYQSL